MMRRTATGKAKNGMTCSQFRRQLCAIAGYLRPQTPALKSSSALRIADEMDDAGLHDRRRKHGGDRLGKSLQAIDDGNQNVLDAAVLEFGHDAQPEFSAFQIG